METLHFSCNNVPRVGVLEVDNFGSGLEEQLSCLTTRMRTWASNNQIEHSQVYITAGMLRQDKRGYPELLGKAYNSRVLLAFLAMCMRALAGQGENDLEVCLAGRVAELMAAWHHFLEMAPRYMSLEEANRLDDTSLRFVQEYKRLAVWAYLGDVRRWKLIPKLHAWRHLNKEMRQSLYNCRFFHAFLDEDAMGSAKRLAKMVHPNLLELRVLSRSRLAGEKKQPASIPEGPSLWLIPPALGRIPFKATWMFRRSIVDYPVVAKSTYICNPRFPAIEPTFPKSTNYPHQILRLRHINWQDRFAWEF